jgi:PHP family Zn ribbon phosphoesterase
MNLFVLTGMEVTSSEEAHILALFDNMESILRLQETVYRNMTAGENVERLFGEQVVANENDEVMGFNKRLLIGATNMSANSIVTEIHSLGGLAIASHIDRDAFSILSQLGFIPEDASFDALELSSAISRKKAEELYETYNSFTWISSSDAHAIDDIGKRTTLFYMNDSSIEEMRMALKSINGRKVEWE